MVKLWDGVGIHVLVDMGLQGIETTVLSLLDVVLTTQELPALYLCFSAQACQMSISSPLSPGLNLSAVTNSTHRWCLQGSPAA